MDFNFGNKYLNNANEKNTDLPIIEVRPIKDLDMYYVIHNTGTTSIKLYDTPDLDVANEIATTFVTLYTTAYLDALEYALYDINSAAELYEELNS